MRISLRFFTYVFAALFMALAVTTIAAQDTGSVFGIRLGQPLAFPECERNEYLTYVGTNTCYKRDKELYAVPEDKKWDKKFIKKYVQSNPPPPLNTEEVIISFSTSDSPQYIDPFYASALLIDARVEGIQFFTFGVSNADLMLGRLKTKYGAPNSLLPLKVKNRLGLPFEAFIATWKLPNLVVTFWSVDTALNRGRVTVDTEKGDAWRTQQLRESLRDKNPL